MGLSPATVARALGDGRNTRPETRRKVQESAERLGYVANTAARILRGHHSHTIGLIVPDIVNSFYATMAKAMAELCEEADHQLVLAVTEDDPDREERQMRTLVSARAAAIALVPSRQPTDETLDLARRQPFAQLIRNSAKFDADRFCIDESSALEQATSHLIGLGHRRILLVCGDDRYSTGVARRQGYLNSLRNAGLAADPELVRAAQPDLEHGQRALEELPDGVTAVIAAGVHLTMGMVEAIEQRGISVPEELSVVGFGDASWQAWWRGGMTAISLPMRQLVLNCGSHLVRQSKAAAGKRQSPSPLVVSHAAALVVGATTARCQPGLVRQS